MTFRLFTPLALMKSKQNNTRAVSFVTGSNNLEEFDDERV